MQTSQRPSRGDGLKRMSSMSRLLRSFRASRPASTTWAHRRSPIRRCARRRSTSSITPTSGVVLHQGPGGTTIGSIAESAGRPSRRKHDTEQADAATRVRSARRPESPTSRCSCSRTNLANLAVSSGRAQLGFADTPVAGYQVAKTHGLFKLVGAAYAPAPYGLATPKGNGLDKAVLAALDVLMKDGTYSSIFSKWDSHPRDQHAEDQRRDQLAIEYRSEVSTSELSEQPRSGLTTSRPFRCAGRPVDRRGDRVD